MPYKTTIRPIFTSIALIAAMGSLPAFAVTSFDSVVTETQTPLSTFQKVYVAPVTVTLDEKGPRLQRTRGRGSRSRDQRPLSNAEKALRASDLHSEMVQALSKEYTVTDTPGEGVLTISVDITRLDSSRPTRRDRATGVAINFGSSVFAGGADYSVKLDTGDTPLVSITESYRGNLNDNLARTDTWYDVNVSFEKLSEQLAQYITQN